MAANKDLTVGEPGAVLRRFCLPMFGSIFFQQLYNLADSFVAGRLISEDALAAVGNSYEITLIFIAFAFGCNIGCSVIVSQLFGAKRMRDMKTAVSTSLISSGVLCAILMTLGLTLGDQLLHLIHTPAHVFADSSEYLRIYTLSLPFVFYYNTATGIFSAMGDSKTPFYFLAASSVTNIGADILFVSMFQMGVAGVAWATLICQGVSCILAIFFVMRRLNAAASGEKAPLFSGAMLKSIASVAVPSILQQSFISVGNIIIQGVINDFGSATMAGYAAAVKLNNLMISSLTTLGNGVSNYAAQNVGAGKPERIHPGYRAAGKMVRLISLPVSLLYFFAGGSLMLFFMHEPTDEAVQTGVTFLRILSPFYVLISIKLVSDGVLRGVKRMKQFMIATFTDLTLRVVLAMVLSGVFGAVGIWSAWPIGWLIATALSVYFYYRYQAETAPQQVPAVSCPAHTVSTETAKGASL
ncbi:MAG: MATE family efflux transporter [Oscillospiraceae bacterium]|nr:MATE family efflux transporter [Oscillospiraceae bacterium]